MTLTETKANQEKFLQAVYKKAWEDESFKQALVSDPAATLERITNGALNLQGKNVQVNDQTDGSTLYLNIPQNPSDVVWDNVELSEAELEAIAGGLTIPTPFGPIVIEGDISISF